jgi:hypothetical protein
VYLQVSSKGQSKKSEGLLMKNKKELTKRQEDTMKKHSKHHTSKHMRLMKSKMLQGMSFGDAHKLAQKEVGK